MAVRVWKRTAPGRHWAIRSRYVTVPVDCITIGILQVGAAVRALCNESGGPSVQCTSLKSNLGHLEAAAAAAGLSSLIIGPLLAGVVAINAQLRGYVFFVFIIILTSTSSG